LKSKFTLVNSFALFGEDNMRTSFLKSNFTLVNLKYYNRLASLFACSNNDATYFWLFCRCMSIFEVYSSAFDRIIF
jgi:hypothetical protein